MSYCKHFRILSSKYKAHSMFSLCVYYKCALLRKLSICSFFLFWKEQEKFETLVLVFFWKFLTIWSELYIRINQFIYVLQNWKKNAINFLYPFSHVCRFLIRKKHQQLGYSTNITKDENSFQLIVLVVIENETWLQHC